MTLKELANAILSLPQEQQEQQAKVWALDFNQPNPVEVAFPGFIYSPETDVTKPNVYIPTGEVPMVPA